MTVADDRRSKAEANYQRLLGQRMSAVDALAATSGPKSSARGRLDNEYENALGNFEATQSELHNRSPHIRFENPWMFWIPAYSSS